MSKTRNQDFLRGTGQKQTRILNIAAAATIAVVAIAFAGYKWGIPVISSSDSVDLSIDVPYVAPGVGKGTKVIIRGAEVGEVTDLKKNSTDSVRMSLSLEPNDIRGLTDAFELDFRPENYFGVTAVNIVGKPGGDRLVSGSVLDRLPAGDFTMSTMIEKGSIAVDGTLTKSMIETLDKIIRYTDGLTPMIQTGIVIADRVAQTQQAMPSTLLADMNQTLDVLPGFSRTAVDTLYNMFDNKMNRLPDGSFGVDDKQMDNADKGLDLTANGLFGAIGRLLASHDREVTPVTQIVAALSDLVPNMLDGGNAASKLSALVDRYSGAFSGPANQKTLNLKIVLDDLPAFATPLALTATPAPHQEMPR